VEYSNDNERKNLISSILTEGISPRVIGVEGVKTEMFCLKTGYKVPSGYIIVSYFGNAGFPDDETVLRLGKKELMNPSNYNFRI
jgi:hypothetical protein